MKTSMFEIEELSSRCLSWKKSDIFQEHVSADELKLTRLVFLLESIPKRRGRRRSYPWANRYFRKWQTGSCRGVGIFHEGPPMSFVTISVEIRRNRPGQWRRSSLSSVGSARIYATDEAW
ncbi:hypothetical protein KM043_012739 [Ampulex compressa]|nr:hypothetical protein KM043_012739 [Ampulex compressa]